MKIKAPNAIFATLDLSIEMAARQRAFQQTIVKILCAGDDEEYAENLAFLNQLAHTETGLIRAKLLPYVEIDIDDFLNGLVDV